MLTLVTLVAFGFPPAWPEQPMTRRSVVAPCTVSMTIPAKAAAPKLYRLGDLPDARLEIAVNRLVDGCPAPVIVRYDVSR